MMTAAPVAGGRWRQITACGRSAPTATRRHCSSGVASGGGRRASLSVRVQGLGCDVGLVGPHDGAGLGVGTQLAEVVRFGQRLEDAAVVAEVGAVSYTHL